MYCVHKVMNKGDRGGNKCAGHGHGVIISTVTVLAKVTIFCVSSLIIPLFKLLIAPPVFEKR